MKALILVSLFCAVSRAAFGFNDAPHCLYDLETHFFPHEVTRQAFDLYAIFQSQWEPILLGLDFEGQRAPELVRKQAREMNPNPLEYPFDPEKTRQVILAVEYEIFRSVVVRNYFYNMQAIRGMFDYIVAQQAGRIEACLGKKPKQRMQKNIK